MKSLQERLKEKMFMNPWNGRDGNTVIYTYKAFEEFKAFVKDFYAFWGDCPEGLKLLIEDLEKTVVQKQLEEGRQ